MINDKEFRFGSLAMAVGGAVVMLGILRAMRAAVGPLRQGKPRRRG